MIEGYYTAEEIKHQLGLKARPGDIRTINKYVKNGKLEVFCYSKKIKIYRPILVAISDQEKSIIEDDWIID